MRKWIYGIGLLEGWFPFLVAVLAVAAGIFLLLRFRRRWWIVALSALAAAAGIAFLAGWAVIHVFYVWPEDLPSEVILWAAVGLAAVLLGVAGFFFRPERWRRVLSPVAALLVLLMAVLQVNAYFGLLTTVGDLVSPTATVLTSIPAALQKHSNKTVDEHNPVAEGWKRPAFLRRQGEVLQSAIPGAVSGFQARRAFVYLPAAYLLKKRPKLPVLVLVSGQPGEPSDWTVSGHLTAMMDAFAAQHNGLAPVVVMPDANGSVQGNTMCMDTSIAKADTYMSVDVPDWIRKTLDVDDNTKHWAIGGYSFGATCAVQMATRHPETYPNFMSFSSEREPALTVDRSRTIALAFAGNTAAFNAEVPLTLMARRRYPDVTGFFAAGAGDADYTANAQVLNAAAQASGMHTQLQLVAGAGHSWKVAQGSMPQALDFLARPLGLVR